MRHDEDCVGRPDIVQRLVSGVFALRAGAGGKLISSSLRFEPNGRISGCAHPNESAWRWEDGLLVILRHDGLPSCIARPRRPDDSRLVFSGPFLLTAERVLHRFEEIASPDQRPLVFSFDLFDTLVARRCYEPAEVFRIVERRSGIRDFAILRQAVERKLFDAGDYAFGDIYTALGFVTGWSADCLAELSVLELREEWDNLFAIRAMVERVRPQDLIVSDMYLPHEFVRRVVDEKCGLPGRALHLSNHGKHHGTIWAGLQSASNIRRHHGDNPVGDVRSAAGAGIDTEQVTISWWSMGERILGELGLGAFAHALREARLACFDPDPRVHRARLVQIEVNVPLLLLASLAVLRAASARKVETLLMCARDCNLWIMLMRWLAPRAGRPLEVHYFVASRVLLLSNSAEFKAYFEGLRGARTMLVDVSGTGRSPSHFIAEAGAQQHTSLFLMISAKEEVSNFIAALAPPRDDVVVEHLMVQSYQRRLVIETLNMSLEGRATRLSFAGGSLEVEREANEFRSAARLRIAAMREGFLGAMSALEGAEITQIPQSLSPELLRSAVQAVMMLGDAYRDVWQPIAEDVCRAEPSVAAAAFAERRNAQAAAPAVPRQAVDAALRLG